MSPMRYEREDVIYQKNDGTLRNWHEPNVLITPHIASETRIPSASAVVAANIARDVRGQTPLYLVDPALKY